MAILAAPAAYSEVASTITDTDDSGTLLGNYLSGRVARGDHDTAAAADFYSRALAEDPTNELILEQAFLLETAAADWGRAVKLARDLIKVEPSHRIAQFLLGCDAFKRGDYKEADEHFAAARQGPIADLTSILARAWVQQAAGKTDQALATLDSLSDADWAQFYQRYHRALIADVAGKPLSLGFKRVAFLLPTRLLHVLGERNADQLADSAEAEEALVSLSRGDAARRTDTRARV